MTLEQHREYRRAWASLSQEDRFKLQAHGIEGPLSENFGRVDRDAEAPNLDTVAHVEPTVYAEEESEESREIMDQARKLAEAGVARVFWVLSQSRHPALEPLAKVFVPLLFGTPADFEKACAIFTACFNPDQSSGFAEVARAHGVCRAATQKQGADMINSYEMRQLRTWLHGGDPKKSEEARQRAVTQHKKSKCKPKSSKPSPFSLI